MGMALPLHFVMELMAFFTGFRYYLYLRKDYQDPISGPNRLWILIGAALGAFLCSRILGGLEDPVAFFDGSTHFLYYYANKTIVGGLLGGLLGVELIKKAIGEQSSSGDLFVYPLLLAIIIGRIGCFSAGVYEETYGIASPLPWAMDLGDGIRRHPAALYEILFLVILWIGLWVSEQRTQRENGLKFRLFMVFYLLFRLSLDFIKPGFRFSFGLSVIQLACLGGLLYYGKTVFSLFTAKKRGES